MSIIDINPVDEYSTAIKQALARAQEIKPLGEIDPPLASEYIEECIENLKSSSRKDTPAAGDVKPNYAAIETACRDVFYNLLSVNSINDTAFGALWSLLDIVSTLSDRELCEPGLIFWLVEELLDSQTIDGCRVVFDYLDSRRDRLTAKHFKEKNLIILRTCNELLRRLSRAEDTVFCGRVFIFLFQSFPLGDKSSVNLRGEFHVENVTAFESLPSNEEALIVDGMNVDHDQAAQTIGEPPAEDMEPISEGPAAESQQTGSSNKSATSGDHKAKQEEPETDMDVLYGAFWSLQTFFSQPTKLFDDTNLETFKRGLHATMRKFRDVQKGSQSRGVTRLTDESRRGVKRKRGPQEDELSSAFNPKYLTSRDLFDLEISDLAFRRHIMVQTLIIVDFLLSLSPKSKKKLEQFNNRAVQYAYNLTDENLKWVADVRAEIADYLTQGPEGKFYYRMVDTVLSRDKNWTYWKAESCPPIARPPVSAEDFNQSIKGVQRSCASKRLKANTMGALDLKFLTETGADDAMENLKIHQRYAVPTVESFERPIADDQFEIDMGSSTEEKQLAEDAKASKLWRTLRIASKNSLKLFDKIDDGKTLDVLFRPQTEESSEKTEAINEETKENSEVGSLVESVQKNDNVGIEAHDAVLTSADSAGDAVQDVPMSETKQEPLEERVEEELINGVTSTTKLEEPPAIGLADAGKETIDG